MSVSDQLGVLNEQYRISITNAMGSTKPTDNEALDSLAFSPDTDISAWFERVTLDDGEADRFAFEKEITCTEYDKLVIINYYRHWLNSAPERTTLLSLNSTLHIGFSEQYQKLIMKLLSKNIPGSKQKIREQLMTFRRVCEEKQKTYPTVTEGYYALLLEIIYLTEQWDLLHLFLQRDPARCVSDMLEEYGTDSRLLHCAEHYHDAMRELEELEALLRNADHSLVCKPFAATGNIRRTACKTKLSFEEDPRTYRMFCDYIWNLTKKPCSFVLRYLSIDMPQPCGQRMAQYGRFPAEKSHETEDPGDAFRN